MAGELELNFLQGPFQIPFYDYSQESQAQVYLLPGLDHWALLLKKKQQDGKLKKGRYRAVQIDCISCAPARIVGLMRFGVKKESCFFMPFTLCVMCFSRDFQLLHVEIFGEDTLNKLLGVVKCGCIPVSCPESLLRVGKAQDVNGLYRWRAANNTKCQKLYFVKYNFPMFLYNLINVPDLVSDIFSLHLWHIDCNAIKLSSWKISGASTATPLNSLAVKQILKKRWRLTHVILRASLNRHHLHVRDSTAHLSTELILLLAVDFLASLLWVFMLLCFKC